MLGTFLRSFRWGQVRHLERVSRELLAQAWAGNGPDGEPLTIDLDSIRSRRTRPLDWSRGRPAPQLRRPARLSPSDSARAGSTSSRLFPGRSGCPRLQTHPAVELVQLAKIRLLTRGDNSSIPVAAPTTDQPVIRANLLASSISGSGDPVASVGIDRPLGAWDRL